MRHQILAAISIAFAMPLAALAKEGAKVQPVDKNGKPTGPAVSVPDCRGCQAKKVGPNHYEVKVPQKTREKVGAGRAE